MTSDERQYAFFRIAAVMSEKYELEKMMGVVRQMEPGQLEKMVKKAATRGEPMVMITDKGYIKFDIDEVRGLQGKAIE